MEEKVFSSSHLLPQIIPTPQVEAQPVAGTAGGHCRELRAHGGLLKRWVWEEGRARAVAKA